MRYTIVLLCSELITATHRLLGLNLSKSENLIKYSKQYFEKIIE